MLLIGVGFLESHTQQTGFSAKMVFNSRGAIIFPHDQQHRDQKVEGISYEDDYAGNALAAMFAPGKIEIRFHREFSDRQVTTIIRSLLAQPRLTFMTGWQVTYQGRILSIS